MTYENKFEFVFPSLLNACHLFLPWHSYGKLDTAEVARGIGAILKTSQIQNRPTCFMLPNYYVHDGRSVCQKISKPNCQFLRLNSFVADSCWNMQACWCPFMSISIQSIEASSCHSLSFQSTSLHIIAHHLYITHHGTLLIAALVCVINSQAWRMHTKHPDVEHTVGGTKPSVRRSAASVTKQWRQLASRPSHGLGQKRTCDTAYLLQRRVYNLTLALFINCNFR